MNSEQPYRPPESDVGGAPAGLAGGSGGAITPTIVDNLKRTRPWVLFMGIMVLLGCVLMVLLALFMLSLAALTSTEEFGGPVGGITIALVYLLMALLYLMPAVHLLRYAAAIKRIGPVDTSYEIEDALKHQLSFWRFVGIVTIAMIGLYLLIIVGAMIVAAVMATSQA